MSSSPSSVKQRSPKRTSHRTPLQERTPSQANEISSRLSRDAFSDQESVYNSTPFPTKAAHVLLPSSIKKQRGGRGPIGEGFSFPPESDAGRSSDAYRALRGGTQPKVKLKRSVKALRDLYEAQAEEASRPSTAASPPLRPTTANSSRLRSLSSNDSFSGPFAWEALRKISSDDLALLPTLPAGGRVVKRLSSRSSFTSLAEKIAATSSPNYRVLGVSSSPRPPAFKDVTSPVLPPFQENPGTDSAEDSSSSPNVIRLGHTSSTEQFQADDEPSSPNVIKLGTSSPTAARPQAVSSFAHSRSSSASSRKRKRLGAEEGRGFAESIGARNPIASSPPVDRYVPTSALASSISSQDRVLSSSMSQSLRHTDSLDDSSSVVQVLNRDEPGSDGSSLADTHASLQAALSSSPPRIQYPIVRAPPPSQEVALIVPKRNSRSLSTNVSGPKYAARLSAVPSEGSWIKTRRVSHASSDPDDLDEYLHSEELAPASNFIINQSANQSQIRVVRHSDSDLSGVDVHEAADAVSALPADDYTYRSPPLRHTRSGSYIGSTTSSLSRLNSMKSFTLSRHNSFISTSLRPSSSSSTASIVVAPVPTWARRYYSGAYRDSFQTLDASASHVSLHNSAAAGQTQQSLAQSSPSRPETSRTANSPIRSHIHQAKARLEGLLRPKTRPRIEARKSHTLPGVGPLVSNPIRGPATAAATTWDARRQSYPPHNSPNLHNRSVSAPLPPLDPRAHWAGMIEIHEQPLEDGRGSSYTIHHHQIRPSSYGYGISRSESQTQSVIYHPHIQRSSHHRWASSPHLHHDHRLNTGSTESRGFGYPFNTKSRWTAPSIVDESSRPWWATADLRTAQIFCFTIGFLLPLTWFVAAFLPLPKRPSSMEDIEKQVYVSSASAQQRYSQSESFRNSGFQQDLDQDHDQRQRPSEWDSMDVIDKLRRERQLAGLAELRWQNARWWRNLNRWMCIVGVLVCVVIIVLAAVGARQNW